MTSDRGSAAGGVVVAPPLAASRRAALFAVRRLGDASVEEVAEVLEMTVSGARQHLTALVEQGLVAAESEPRVAAARGRTRLLYHVTDLGDALFPKAYAALTNELLDYLAAEEPDTIERLFAKRRQHRVDNAAARLAPLRSLRSRVDELARILDEDGYLAVATHGKGRHVIAEHNCAIASVARRYGQACTSELEFIRAVLPEADVRRISHMIQGDRHCGYEIVASRG
jgi:DeoR family transcriptional regulator, suf operon transcriptional repressor